MQCNTNLLSLRFAPFYHNGDNYTNIVHFAAVIPIVRKMLLHFPRKRAVDFGVQARCLGLRCDGERQCGLKGWIIMAIVFSVMQREVPQCPPDPKPLFSEDPCIDVFHLSADNSEDIESTEIVPHAIGSEYQNITVTDLMRRNASIARVVAKWGSAKRSRSSQDFGRDN